MSACAVASIVTVNYIANAIAVSYYLRESNPGLDYVVLVLANSDDLPKTLPNSVKWICWDKIVNQCDRVALASTYTPFELCCVLRGRFHNYLITQSAYSMWVMLDTDIGVYSPLETLWDALGSYSIILTPHLNKPVSAEYVTDIEGPVLGVGLYNAGVLAMQSSRIALDISIWMINRFERFGRSHKHRISAGLGGSRDFEFVDQNWLNHVPIFFGEGTLILRNPIFNLGHWNLQEGKLSINEDTPMFNGERVVFVHFSGLPPSDSLAVVSIHTDRYRSQPCSAWAFLASDYLAKLSTARSLFPAAPYSYSAIQPGSLPLSIRPPGLCSCALLIISRLRYLIKSILRMFARLIGHGKHP